MKGRTLLATTLVAVALAAAACSPKAPTPTPTPNLGAPYSCVEPGKSQIAHLTPGVSFSFGDTCDKVVNVGDYIVAAGFDSEYASGSRAYVFKTSSSSPSGLGIIGAAPNVGEHKHIAIVRHPNLGDLLVTSSIIAYDPNTNVSENNRMLDAIAQAHNLRNFMDWRNNVIHYGSKIAVYRLDTGRPIEQVTKFEPVIGSDGRQRGFREVVVYELAKSPQPIEIQQYNPNVKPEVVILEEIAAWPVLFGWDVEIEGMEVVKKDGKPMLEIKTSEIKPNGNRCQLIPGVVDLEQVIKGGIVTDVPLLKDVYCK